MTVERSYHVKTDFKGHFPVVTIYQYGRVVLDRFEVKDQNDEARLGRLLIERSV